jgi:spore photoproduct lyase
MEAARGPENILPAWSLNAPEVVSQEERQTTTLKERLQAAQECAKCGFRVCLHFDPIIRFPGWENGYGQVVDMIFDYLRPQDIAYLSLGSFRGMPELKEHIALNWPESTYIYNEYLTGLDGKFRLLRPLRVEQFRFMVRRLQKHGLDRQIYLCMESDEVWRAVFGYTPADLGGLSRHLLAQAFARFQDCERP